MSSPFAVIEPPTECGDRCPFRGACHPSRYHSGSYVTGLSASRLSKGPKEKIVIDLSADEPPLSQAQPSSVDLLPVPGCEPLHVCQPPEATYGQGIPRGCSWDMEDCPSDLDDSPDFVLASSMPPLESVNPRIGGLFEKDEREERERKRREREREEEVTADDLVAQNYAKKSKAPKKPKDLTTKVSKPKKVKGKKKKGYKVVCKPVGADVKAEKIPSPIKQMSDNEWQSIVSARPTRLDKVLDLDLDSVDPGWGGASLAQLKFKDVLATDNAIFEQLVVPESPPPSVDMPPCRCDGEPDCLCKNPITIAGIGAMIKKIRESASSCAPPRK